MKNLWSFLLHDPHLNWKCKNWQHFFYLFCLYRLAWICSILNLLFCSFHFNHSYYLQVSKPHWKLYFIFNLQWLFGLSFSCAQISSFPQNWNLWKGWSNPKAEFISIDHLPFLSIELSTLQFLSCILSVTLYSNGNFMRVKFC